MKTPINLSILAVALIAACDDGPVDDGFRRRDLVGDEAPPEPTCAEQQKGYAGFGGTKLEAGRTEYEVATERMRMKPFEALKDDYRRLLGVEPPSLTASGPTFGEAPARWYAEPAPGAVSLYQAYRIAFDACNEHTKLEAKWATAPTAASAKKECAAWQRKFWSRTPEVDEIEACAKVATTDAAFEAVAGGETRATEPRRRWAYACASVLASSDFLMY